MVSKLPLRRIRPYEEMYLAGLPATTIARLLGVSRASVWQGLKNTRDYYIHTLMKRRGRYDPHYHWEKRRDRKTERLQRLSL